MTTSIWTRTAQTHDREVLRIARTALRDMATDAKSAFPHECCGFMFGHNQSQSRRRELVRVLRVENREEAWAERRFQVSPLDYMRAERKAAEWNLDLLGVYHSHPLHPAVPSAHDLAVALPAFSYIILSAFDDVVVSVRSWRLNDEGTFNEEFIEHL